MLCGKLARRSIRSSRKIWFRTRSVRKSTIYASPPSAIDQIIPWRKGERQTRLASRSPLHRA